MKKFLPVLWLLALLYALFASLYTILFGCTCTDITVMGDCHRTHLPEGLGGIAWVLLLPAGLWLFRHSRRILRCFAVYGGLTAVCVLLWMTMGQITDVLLEFAFSLFCSVFLLPLHGLAGLGLPDTLWKSGELVWALAVCVGSLLLLHRISPRKEPVRITFQDAYKTLFVLTGVVYIQFALLWIEYLIGNTPGRLPERAAVIGTVLWLALLTGGLWVFRRSRWMEGLVCLTFLQAVGLAGTTAAHLLPEPGIFLLFVPIGCTSPMVLPPALFWELLSYGPPNAVICGMALVLDLALLVPSWIFMRKDFPRVSK